MEIKTNRESKAILRFDEIGIKDVSLVGGKNASLGEMYINLTQKGVKVPNGFAITASAYFNLLEETGAKKDMLKILGKLDTKNIKKLMEAGEKARALIMNLKFPEHLSNDIRAAYRELSTSYKVENLSVAVRSSATAEDLPDASFAWQQESYLNISGEENLLIACKKCFASLFTNRAISYRHEKWFDDFDVGLSIVIQKMVRSDLASSWVMFTLDTESGFKDAILINSIYGLGENIVQWRVSPDEYMVWKTGLKKGKKAIISKKLGSKELRMIYSNHGLSPVKNVNVSIEDQEKFSLSDDDVMTLSKWAVIIEDHYKKPMDMEWARDWKSNELYIVQARPETVQSRKDENILEEYVLQKEWKILVSGASVGAKIGSGKANIIKSVDSIENFKKWDVLVTEMTDPDREPIMKIASAIVTNSGGRTCHAAIISRELWIPCVVWTTVWTSKIAHGKKITVSCSWGEEWKIYDGEIPFTIKKVRLDKLEKAPVKILMNIANPDVAFTTSFIPNDGVGLAREEFIINTYIKAHPKALLNFDSLEEGEVKDKISTLTKGYDNKTDYFIDKLSEWVGKLGAAFYPKSVIVRFSDFKSNEYANLLWWKSFEPIEDNPMIGWRGASRYYDSNYEEAFALECKAIKKTREEIGLDNIIVMVPFCRTLDEAKSVLKVMKKNWLEQGKNGLQVYMMVEIPSNVILIEQFAQIFDGFSIGSNDLTQLTLWVDRDSSLVAHVYDERNDAVKIMIKQAIAWAKKYKKKIGICGQAPSDFPDFAQFLLDEGIDSISLNPDTVLSTRIKLTKKKK